ncbi:hypothetical protein ABPG72_019055 [Tetrahymena utriculariae]
MKIYTLEELQEQDVKDVIQIEIDWSMAYYGKEEIYKLSQEISKCFNLDYLIINLKGNSIGNEYLGLLAQNITKCTKIYNLELILEWNSIWNQGIQKFGAQIQKLTNLINLSLDLRINSIRKEGALYLGQAISHFSKLQNLELFLGNNFVREGAVMLLLEIRKCQDIQRLALEFNLNSIDDNDLQQFGQNILNFKNLKEFSLDLKQNYELTSMAQSKLVNQIQKCQKLTCLKFCFENIDQDEEVYQQILNSLYKIKRLTFFQLSI